MKGGIQGLKVSHISFVLIGLVCVTVLTFAWTKTTWLTSFIPSQNRTLQLDLDNAGPGETLEGNNNSVQTWEKQIDPLGSPGISEKGNIEDVTTIDTGGTPAGVVERTGSEEVSQRKNKPYQADKPYVESDETGNLSTTTGNKESFDSVIERTDSHELSHRKNKPEQVDIVPESGQSDETRNLTATSGNEDNAGPGETLGGNNNSVQTWKNQIDSHGSPGISEKGNIEDVITIDKGGETPASVLERIPSYKHPKGKNKSKQAETVPGDSSTDDSSVETDQTRNSSAITTNKDCNYAKGKWVFDGTRPLYSGSACKQWLSSMWACRLTQRTDFDYEKLIWQPKDCKPEPFTSSKFLQRMQHKTLAFIGDSLGRQQFQSLMCMATGGEERIDIGDVGPEYGLVKARGKVRPDGWAYRFSKTNTTVLYYWSASLSDLVPIDPTNSSSDIAMNLDRPPEFLRRFIHKFHVIVLNTGHHWNRGKLDANRWVMYVGGKPSAKMEIADAKNFTVRSIVKWVDSEMKVYPGLKAFFRTISPRHFFNGDWNTGGTCDNTVPRGKEVVEDESRDTVVSEAVKGSDVRILDITGLSELRDEGHISRYSVKGTSGMQDCLHWCLPGIPDAWNEILFAQI